MPKANDTFTKIGDYLEEECEALSKSRKSVSRLHDNPADVGSDVELIYQGFLERHVPSACDVLRGGYVYDVDGNRSAQMDIIVISGNAPRLNDGDGKACATLEGTVANIEVTSYLGPDKIDIELGKFARIPNVSPLEDDGKVSPFTYVKYERDNSFREFWLDTPYKGIVAFDGVDGDFALNRINAFYNERNEIPVWRRPNIIHMVGGYYIVRIDSYVKVGSLSGDRDVEQYPNGSYSGFRHERLDSCATGLILSRIAQNLGVVTERAHMGYNLHDRLTRAMAQNRQ